MLIFMAHVVNLVAYANIKLFGDFHDHLNQNMQEKIIFMSVDVLLVD